MGCDTNVYLCCLGFNLLDQDYPHAQHIQQSYTGILISCQSLKNVFFKGPVSGLLGIHDVLLGLRERERFIVGYLTDTHIYSDITTSILRDSMSFKFNCIYSFRSLLLIFLIC